MKINCQSKSGMSVSSAWGWTPLFGGVSTCTLTFSPGIAAQGIDILNVNIIHAWMVNGQIIASQSNFVDQINSNGILKTSQSLIMGGIPTAQAELVFVVDIGIQNPDGSYTTWRGTTHTGVYNFSAPGQVQANVPEGSPIQSGIAYNAYCGIDYNGTNTHYEAEVQNGSIVNISGNHFAIIPNAPNCSWRARAVNDQGTGAWSSWCSFSVDTYINNPVVSAYAVQHPSKPIIALYMNGSISVPSGVVITSSKFIYGGTTINNGTTSSPSASVNSVSLPITVQLQVIYYDSVCAKSVSKEVSVVVNDTGLE